MKLCVASGTFHRLAAEETLAEIHRAGYEYVELNRELLGPDDATDADAARLRDLLDANDLKPAAVLMVYQVASPDEAERLKAVESFRRGIRLARAMGAQSLTTRMTGDVSRADECRRAFMRSMEALVPLLEEAGLRASIEPHPRHFVEHNDEAVDLIREIGSPYVGYLYCMAHTFWLGDDAARMIRYAAGTLTHVHVADTHRPERIVSAGRDARPHNHFIPGWGEVDFESTFRALLDMGYDGYLSAELYSHPDDPAGAIRQTREKVSALLARLAEERQRA